MGSSKGGRLDRDVSMNLRFIRPEDRRRSGGSGTGPGFGSDWADTEPACFRSEAFAEDLPQCEQADHAPAGRARALLPVHLLRHRHGWVPVFGLALAAALGLGAAD